MLRRDRPSCNKPYPHAAVRDSVGEQDRELRAWFARTRRTLEDAYLATDNPIRQSGFSGGADRWRREREPILEAVDRDGDLLDIGCANGHLLECLVTWGKARGRTIVPYGVDYSKKLIALARRRLPRYASHFYVANA